MTTEKSPKNCGLRKPGENFPFAAWLWHKEEISQPKIVLEFLVKNGCNRIYLTYEPDIGVAVYRRFVSAASAAGVQVSLMGADARWVLAEGRRQQEAFFSFYEAYQQSAETETLFYGMHMDIEPYQLAQWETDREEVIAGYCAFVLSAKEIALRTGTQLELDIPCWFNRFSATDNGEQIPLSEFCFRKADAITLMAYRDNAKSILDFAGHNMELAQRYQKPVVLGVETGRIYEDENVTFDHLGTIILYQALSELRSLAEQVYPQCSLGYAVHHYNTWRALPKNGHPKGDDFPYKNPNYQHI